MNKSEVKIGTTYRCKVTGKLADVRITGVSAHGGWDAVNVVTNRQVRIKSAQRLRGPATHAPAAKRKKIVSLDEYEADVKATTPATRATKAEKPTKDAKAATKRHTGERGATSGHPDGKPMSLLSAAAHLLSLGTGDAMRCKDIVDLAVKRGLWTPRTGKTPASTLYAAIGREIKTKGDASRFVKTQRGKFALASKS